VPAAPGADVPVPAAKASRRPQARPAQRQRRVARHRPVQDLRARGLAIRQVGLNVESVRRSLSAARCPDGNPGRQPPTPRDAFAPASAAWVTGGGRNAAALSRDLASQGCRARDDALRRFVRRRLGTTGRPGPRTGATTVPPPPPPSARPWSFALLRRPENRTTEEQDPVACLTAGGPPLQDAWAVAGAFAAMVRTESPRSRTEWLAKAEPSASGERRGVAPGLRQDAGAVPAALTERWSDGPVAGPVNRLKLRKRQRYGRARCP
jgi:hypothetical protein